MLWGGLWCFRPPRLQFCPYAPNRRAPAEWLSAHTPMKSSSPGSSGTGRDERWGEGYRLLAGLTARGEGGARTLGELRDLKRRDVLPADINPAVARLQAKLQALERDPQRLEAAARQLASAPAA